MQPPVVDLSGSSGSYINQAHSEVSPIWLFRLGLPAGAQVASSVGLAAPPLSGYVGNPASVGGSVGWSQTPVGSVGIQASAGSMGIQAPEIFIILEERVTRLYGIRVVAMNHPQAPATVVGDQAPVVVPTAVVEIKLTLRLSRSLQPDVLMSTVAGLIPPHLRTEADTEEAR
ncbi:hypothetical protein OROMI_009852 [Orobanche minor]